MKKKLNYSVISYQAEMANEALGELLTADGQASAVPLDEETALAATVPDFDRLCEIFRRRPPVFIRHIHPAEQTVELCGERERDLEALCGAAESFKKRVTQRYSVQCRILGKHDGGLAPFDINIALSAVLAASEQECDVKNPVQVLSVTIANEKAYMGFSLAKDNLSSWAGGRIRFRREDGRLSRAEFKLLEAEQTLGVALFPGARVLDLGAAPGGWSRIALERGCSVVAVDPAEPDSGLLARRGITHIKKTAQEYLEAPENDFDFILNDMRMAPEESAALIARFQPCLKDGGTVVLTLKLFGDKPRRQMLRALDTLGNYYSIVHVRQLFHNRSEVTVILRKE